MEAQLTMLGRITLGMILGFVVGAERERRGSTAGDRTFALVSLGAAGFTAVGIENFPATAEKLIAGVVTGIGFLGAGLILKEGSQVFGLTTAASLWATSSAGIFAGAGEYLLAVSTVLLIVTVLESPYIPGIRRLHIERPAPPEEREQLTD